MKLRDQCKHGRWDAHGVRPSRNNPKPTRCPGGRLIEIDKQAAIVAYVDADYRRLTALGVVDAVLDAALGVSE